MTIKVKLSIGSIRQNLAKPWVKATIAAVFVLGIVGSCVFVHEYMKYGKIVDARMSAPLFPNTAKIYALPRTVKSGDKMGPREIAAQLRHAEYSDADNRNESQSKVGTYRLHSDSIEIMPGPNSYYSSATVKISFAGSLINKISGGGAQPELTAYDLEPQLVTGLYDQAQRSKRRLVTYDDIPKNLRNGIISIEDRRFFEHGGVNYVRLVKAAWKDAEAGQNLQGGSTLTMQLAKGFFLSPEKSFSRKLKQILIATQIERRFSKQQIFEAYVNWVPMGQRGSFAIDGMGEASQVYFGKDIKSIDLPEAALLAAMIQRPSSLNPFRHPEEALKRRNLVLDMMIASGSITLQEANQAKAAPLKLTTPSVDATDAPYFVDQVRDTLLADHSHSQSQSNDEWNEDALDTDGLRIYTTLDPDLQKAATEAVQTGAAQVDELLRNRRTKKVKGGKGKNAKTETTVVPGPQAQMALIAIDPHTGQVLALVGGRNYGVSQFNHAVAKRPTGSIFKPFVYAAALNSAVVGGGPAYTETTLLEDTRAAYHVGNKLYEPRNYHNEYHGQVIARYALAHSLNNATVELANRIGFDQVAELAHADGISSVRATPAMALGAYDATPLEMAGAYTAFANGGQRVSPSMIASIRDAEGNVIKNYTAQTKPVMDPRVAYVATNMMEAVINNGTAAGVRTMGFTAPAAGKTGTSHDGWFAGYTSNLLCIVWVGFDDYSDLKLEGAHSAAPIWAAFMKKAVALPRYKDVTTFPAPAGVVVVKLDKNTNLISNAACTDSYDAAFIVGTEPRETCDHKPVDQPVAPTVVQPVNQTPAIPPNQSNTQVN